MKLTSAFTRKKARIEIIPLIDIMFFLLAAFMLVSLSMIQMRGMKVNLPTAQSATQENRSDFVTITINPEGDIYLEKDKLDVQELTARVQEMYQNNNEVRFYINGDKDALHGEVVGVLDAIRAAGVQKVAFAMKQQSVTTPGAPAPKAGAPVPGAPPAPPAVPPTTAPASAPPAQP